MKCPGCQHESPADAVFCQECGKRPELACPGCGTANRLGAKFCKKCGQSVAMMPPAAAGVTFRSPESYTPKHLAEKIVTSKSALEGERKQITVLFADLKGSYEAGLFPDLEYTFQARAHARGHVRRVPTGAAARAARADRCRD